MPRSTQAPGGAIGAQHPCPLEQDRTTSDGTGGIRYFSDESEDYKEYRRWKLWLSHKFKTLDKLQADARGPYRFTRLSGTAVETVEHADPAEHQQDGGEQVLLRLLDARFPERDQANELAEVLNEVFPMRATEGESLRAWVSRATDLFDRCERKGGVKFPEEARGFVLVKWSGLTEEQQAVVKGHECCQARRDQQGDAKLLSGFRCQPSQGGCSGG